MILRKAAIVFQMHAAFAAGFEIRDELLKLGGAALYFDGDKDLSRRRLDQDVYAIRHIAVALAVRLEQNVARQPAALQDQR